MAHQMRFQGFFVQAIAIKWEETIEIVLQSWRGQASTEQGPQHLTQYICSNPNFK